MSRINFGRVIAGGVLAGVVINLFEYVLNAIVMAPEWSAIQKSLMLPEFSAQAVSWFNVAGFGAGIAAVWTYAAIRPRFGAGPKTAVIAGLLTWVTASRVLADAKPVAAGMLPLHPVVVMLAVEIVAVVAATVAGAWLLPGICRLTRQRSGAAIPLRSAHCPLCFLSGQLPVR